MKSLNISTLAAALLILAGCSSETPKSAAPAAPLAVTVATVESTDGAAAIHASGRTEAVNSANISTRMMGFVTKLNVKTGQSVAKGTVLVTVNSADLEVKLSQVNAGIAAATAGYTNAKRDYDRFTTLFQQQSASQKELDDMTARYEMAKAQLESAQQMKNEVNAQFSYASIRAPFAGVITNTFVKEGDMANPGMPLVTIETPNQIEITAMVAESDIAHIKEGQVTELLVKSTGATFTGKVREVSLSAKNTGGQYLVKITPDKMPTDVLPGMFVNVQFKGSTTATKSTTTAVMLPKSALVEEGQLKGVYTIGEGSVAILRWLRIGSSVGDQVEVLSGLSAGEKYITSSDGRVFNGATVTIH